MTTIKTVDLAPGDVVCTTEPDGSDFGLPLVRPVRGRKGRVARAVRNSVHCRGGMVVWFADGTKTPPVNGRTMWETPAERAAPAPRPASQVRPGTVGVSGDEYAFLDGRR